jgi:hypothetical protein
MTTRGLAVAGAGGPKVGRDAVPPPATGATSAMTDDESSRRQNGDMGTNGTPERLTRMERDERDDRILQYRLADGLTLAEIAAIEDIERSTVLRSLRRTYQRWRGNPLDIGSTLRASLHRLQAISDHGMREATFEKDRRTKMLCLRTAALAEGFTHRLLMMLGMIGPDALPAAPDPEHATASDIRRLAEEVQRAGVRALPPSDADLMSDGERAWLEGETVEPDEPPVIDASASAPAPAFAPAPRPARTAPVVRTESAANAITTDNGRRQTGWELVTPPGER